MRESGCEAAFKPGLLNPVMVQSQRRAEVFMMKSVGAIGWTRQWYRAEMEKRQAYDKKLRSYKRGAPSKTPGPNRTEVGWWKDGDFVQNWWFFLVIRDETWPAVHSQVAAGSRDMSLLPPEVTLP